MVDDQSESRETHLRDDPLLSKVPEVEGYKVLEPCVLYAKVGEGGMGAVYRGRHLNLDIDVAIKCLKNVLAEQSPAFVTRFQREARIAASVHHQNLVQVYDISEKNGVHYLVMEYVRGETARERVARKKKLKESEALKILLGAASGLAEAHGKRIVHRDIKPDNILISYDGAVKVSDLGLAKALEVDAGPSLTMGVMGTPQYMAPEQWEDSATVGPQADVWALGATFYFLLTGDHAIPAGSMQQIYRRVCVDPFPDVQEKVPSISAQSKAILERCVQRDPKLRYADCRELLRELSKIVVKDSGGSNLSDTESGTTRVPPLLSPPPAETMGHIRVALQDVGTKTLNVATPAPTGKPSQFRAEAPQPVPAPPPAPPLSPSSPKKSRTPLLALSISAPVLVLAWFLFKQVGSQEPVQAAGDGPKAAPSSAGRDTGGSANKQVEEDPNGSGGANQQGGEVPPPAVIGGNPTKVEATRIPLEETKPAVVVLPAELALDHSVADGPIFTRDGVPIQGEVGNRKSGKVSLVDERGRELQTAALVDGKFEFPAPQLEEGDHTLEVVFEEEREAVHFVCDRTAPTVNDPGLPAIFNKLTYDLELGVQDEHLTDVLVEAATGQSRAEKLEGEQLWSVSLALVEGPNLFTAIAADAAGNRRELQLSLLVDVTAPSRPEVTPPESERLIPGTANFSLGFAEPDLSVQLEGFETKTTDSNGKIELSAPIAAGMERYPLKGRVIDTAGNELLIDLSWAVMKEPKHPSGWAIDDSAGQDADYCAKRVQDQKTQIWFVLLPHGEGSKTFMAETEVTREQWKQSAGATKGLQTIGSELADDFPVTRISWKEADKFCRSFGYHLPTPALWRTACLGGSAGSYSCSLKELSTQAWFAQPNPSPVRKLKPNAFGLYDMHGNVWEWCNEENQALGGSHYGREGDLAVNRAPRTSGATADIGFRPVYREQNTLESPR